MVHSTHCSLERRRGLGRLTCGPALSEIIDELRTTVSRDAWGIDWTYMNAILLGMPVEVMRWTCS